jgi:hypothetical protein
MAAKKTAPRAAKEGTAGARIQARIKATPLLGFLAGGEERDLAFIFAPVAGEENAVLFGRLVREEQRVLNPEIGTPARCLTFSPAIFQRKGEDAEPLIIATTVLSTSLALRIEPKADVGGCFALQYLGTEKSDNPVYDAARVYKVVQQSPAKLREALDALGAVRLSAMLADAQ